MDVCVKLLADDAWSAEDDKTGFLSVEVDTFDWIFLKEIPISLPTMQISTIKWKKIKLGYVRELNKSKCEGFKWMITILRFVRPPPLLKNRKIEKYQTINFY